MCLSSHLCLTTLSNQSLSDYRDLYNSSLTTIPLTSALIAVLQKKPGEQSVLDTKQKVLEEVMSEQSYHIIDNQGR